MNKVVMDLPPIGIGGTGGSGTRVVAEICKNSGVFIGNNINISNDNLSYPNLLKLVFSSNELEQIKNTKAQQVIHKFVMELTSQYDNSGLNYGRWGWKAPGTFFGLKYFVQCLPNMLYIHVVRNGFDMAFSKNQNQLRAWASILNIDMLSTELPIAAIDYWIKANELAIKNGRKYLGKNFHIVNFDELCHNPKTEIKKLLDFIGVEVNSLNSLVSLVKPPVSLGRHKKYNYLQMFNKNQIEKVNRINSFKL